MNSLYNLNNDPMEKANLAKKEPAKAKAMLKRLKEYVTTMSTFAYPPKDQSGDPSYFDGVWNSGWC